MPSVLHRICFTRVRFSLGCSCRFYNFAVSFGIFHCLCLLRLALLVLFRISGVLPLALGTWFLSLSLPLSFVAFPCSLCGVLASASVGSAVPSAMGSPSGPSQSFSAPMCARFPVRYILGFLFRSPLSSFLLFLHLCLSLAVVVTLWGGS